MTRGRIGKFIGIAKKSMVVLLRSMQAQNISINSINFELSLKAIKYYFSHDYVCRVSLLRFPCGSGEFSFWHHFRGCECVRDSTSIACEARFQGFEIYGNIFNNLPSKFPFLDERFSIFSVGRL